jgi:hypothetical protein
MSSEVAVGPFSVDLTDENLLGLRRVAPPGGPIGRRSPTIPKAYRWPVSGVGARLGTDYNRRAVEARLNAVPQFMTETDGLAIHFVHIRSGHCL